MDQRTEPIRQDIDAIRESMTDKMEQIESKIKGTVEDTKRMVDVKYQVSEHPWAALGAAVLVGYALGSMGGESSAAQPSAGTAFRYYPEPADERRHATAERAERVQYSAMASSQQPNRASEPGLIDQLKSQFGDEIDMLKAAAMTSLVGLVRDTIRQNLPALNQEVERLRGERGQSNNAPAHAYGTASARAAESASRYYDTAATSPRERAVGDAIGTQGRAASYDYERASTGGGSDRNR
jgi:hypothetical protein